MKIKALKGITWNSPVALKKSNGHGFHDGWVGSSPAGLKKHSLKSRTILISQSSWLKTIKSYYIVCLILIFVIWTGYLASGKGLFRHILCR